MSNSQTTSGALTWNALEDCGTEIDKGEFCYRRGHDGRAKWLHFWPHDSPCVLSAAITPQKNASGATWTLSGTDDAPTLQPSVNAVGIWHGFLTNGSAKSV